MPRPDRPASPPPGENGFRRALSRFWLRRFFRLSQAAPALTVALRAPVCAAVFFCSPGVRRGALANAKILLAPSSTRLARMRLAWRTLSNFYLVCCDISASAAASRQELLARIERVDGRPHYDAIRAQRRGAIVVTAHMGSFEAALAALCAEEKNVHVLFRRDEIGEFDRQRSDLRRRIGVNEVIVDQAWTIWLTLRQALHADHVVVIQADRVMPGQKGQSVGFLGGRMMLPTSPIKLALASGAPVIPIFSLRTPRGKVRIQIQPPLNIDPDHPDAAMKELAAVLEKQIKSHPDQWLLLTPAPLASPAPSP